MQKPRNRLITRFEKTVGIILTPILLSIYPVIFLYEQNKREVIFSDVPRSIIGSFLITLTIFVILFVILRKIRISLLTTSICLLFFYSYGHLYRTLKTGDFLDGVFGHHRILLSMYLVLGIAVLYLALRRPKLILCMRPMLSLLALFLIVPPCISLISYGIRTHRNNQAELGRILIETENNPEIIMDIAPDVYYIILDGYGRSDVLMDVYDFDNQYFIQALSERGFYIAEQSHANYAHTAISLSATLNLSYVEDLGIQLENADYPDVYRERLLHNFVRSTFEDLGYTIISTDSGWTYTQWVDVDSFRSYEIKSEYFPINSFEFMLVETTALKPLLDIYQIKTLNLPAETIQPGQRSRILATFDDLPRIARMDGPKFVFSHIVSPHPPYVFDRNGDYQPSSESYSLSDTSSLDTLDIHRLRYGDQAMYISQRMIEAIDAILESSRTPPIVILQSDHGPGLGISWGDTSDVVPEQIFDRMAILNSFLLPSDCQPMLYPQISSINSFRVVLNCIAGTEFSLLQDHAFFSGKDPIHNFRNVDIIIHQDNSMKFFP